MMYDLGMRLNFYMDCSGGGSSTEALIGLAIGAIEGGMCDTVAIFRAMNGYSQVRIGGTGARAAAPIGGSDLLKRSYGVASAVQNFAFTFTRHMMEYGVTGEHLANIKVTHSKHASNNPKALMKQRVTVDDVLNSRWIVKPCAHLAGLLPRNGQRDLHHRYIGGARQGLAPPAGAHHWPCRAEA